MTAQSTPGKYPTSPLHYEQSDIRLPEPPRSAPFQAPASPGFQHEIRPLFSSSSSEGKSTGSSKSATGLRSNGETAGTADTSLGSEKSRLAELIIAEIDAEIEASQHGEQEECTAISLADDAETQHTSLAIADATARIKQLRVSYEYIAYRSDVAFKAHLARTYRSLVPVRADGRIAAFEHSPAYGQYLEDMELVRQHGLEHDAAALEKMRPDGVVGAKKKRENGDWIRQWHELGVGDRKNSMD
ncbi:MAG: hypothetical protein Q9191_003074 [Dirinaria sp. TL-2023a]